MSEGFFPGGSVDVSLLSSSEEFQNARVCTTFPSHICIVYRLIKLATTLLLSSKKQRVN